PRPPQPPSPARRRGGSRRPSPPLPLGGGWGWGEGARSVLAQLTIRDLAIIDRLTIEWSRGLNVVTGETGAGKSIIIDAVGALLGGRISPDFVRSGASRATVEGVFDLSTSEDVGELRTALDEHGLEIEDGGLILSRDI